MNNIAPIRNIPPIRYIIACRRCGNIPLTGLFLMNDTHLWEYIISMKNIITTQYIVAMRCIATIRNKILMGHCALFGLLQ